MKKIIMQIKFFFHAILLGKPCSIMALNELMIAKKFYERKIKEGWNELQPLFNSHIKKKNSTKDEPVKEFIELYDVIQTYEERLTIIKVAIAGLNAAAKPRDYKKSNNEKIYQHGMYQNRLVKIEHFITLAELSDYKEIEKFLKKECTKYTTRIQHLTAEMDRFNNNTKSVLPFLVEYSS